VLERRQKGILNQVLSVLAMPQKPHRERHGSRQIQLDDAPEGVTLPISNASKKLAFLSRSIVGVKHQ
jgi:hypothetical protein